MLSACSTRLRTSTLIFDHSGCPLNRFLMHNKKSWCSEPPILERLLDGGEARSRCLCQWNVRARRRLFMKAILRVTMYKFVPERMRPNALSLGHTRSSMQAAVGIYQKSWTA